MKFHLLDYLVEVVKRTGHISVLDAFVYENFNDHMKRNTKARI